MNITTTIDMNYPYLVTDQQEIRWSSDFAFNKNVYKKSGKTLGIGLSWKGNRWLEIGMGLNYSNKGFKVDGIAKAQAIDGDVIGSNKFHEEISVILNYIEVPVVIKRYIEREKVQVVIGAAANIGYLISVIRRSKVDQEPFQVIGQGDPPVVKKRQTIHTQLNKCAFSPGISLGVAFDINKYNSMELTSTFRFIATTIDSNLEKFTIGTFGLGVVYNINLDQFNN